MLDDADVQELHANQFNLIPSEVVEAVTHLISRKNGKKQMPPFIWGAPGIGKTDLARTIAKMRFARLVAMHLPQYDPTDLKGIPVRLENGVIKWMPSSYLPKQITIHLDPKNKVKEFPLDFPYAEFVAAYVIEDGQEVFSYQDSDNDDFDLIGLDLHAERREGKWFLVINRMPKEPVEITVVDKAIVFLDELSAADPSTQNAALQLVLDRRVGEYDLPHATPIMAAGNRETDGGFVQPLSAPLANRFEHITMVPSLEDFTHWATMSGIIPEVIAYLRAKPDALFNYDPDKATEGDYAFPTPRSWADLSGQWDPSLGAKLRRAIAAGLVGRPQALDFIAYIEEMGQLPTPLDIIEGKVTELPPMERSKTFGVLIRIIYYLRHEYEKREGKSTEEFLNDSGWTKIKNPLINFVEKNFENEAAMFFQSMLKHLNVPTVTLRGEAYARFSQRFVDVLAQSRSRRNRRAV